MRMPLDVVYGREDVQAMGLEEVRLVVTRSGNAR